MSLMYWILFVQRGFKNANFYNWRMYELIKHFCHPEIFQFLNDNISLNVTPKELKISPRLKFYTSFCTQRHMHMFKNINSGVVSDVSIEGRYGAKCDVLE